MLNKGIVPLDPETLVGQLRVLLRDTDYVDLTPHDAGLGDYAVFSDVDLAAYLIKADGDLNRAAGEAIRGLALEYSASGKSIKTDDLVVDLRSRGADLLKVAQAFFDEATAAGEAAANDFFQIVPFGGRAGRSCPTRPEATPWPVC